MPEKETLHVKNRVGNFFYETGTCVGKNRLASQIASGKNQWFCYDERRGSSLAQGKQWSKEDCDKLANTIKQLGNSNREAIKEFSDFGKLLDKARANNALSLTQTGAFAAWGLLKTGATFIANSTKAAPIFIGGGKGYLPTGLSVGEGIIGVNNSKAFASAISSSQKGGVGFYAGVSAGNSGSDFAGMGANRFFDSVQRILDPAGRLSEVQIDAADFGSQDLSESLQFSQGVQKNLQDSYKKNCQ